MVLIQNSELKTQINDLKVYLESFRPYAKNGNAQMENYFLKFKEICEEYSNYKRLTNNFENSVELCELYIKKRKTKEAIDLMNKTLESMF